MTTFAAAKQRTGHSPKIIHGGHRSAEDARRWLAHHLRSKAARPPTGHPTRSSYIKAAELLEAGGAPTLFGSVYTIICEEAIMTDEQEWEELPLEGYPGEILKVRATTRWERAAEARYELKDIPGDNCVKS